MTNRTTALALAIVSLLLLLPWSVSAQEPDRSSFVPDMVMRDWHDRLLKVTIGATMSVIGAVVAGKSSQSTSVMNALGTRGASSRSTSQLLTGLVIAGAGGIVLWQGVRAHDLDVPNNVVVGVAVGPWSGSLFVRRSW
jgi:hypothetical protein